MLPTAVLFSFAQKFSAALGWVHKFLNNHHTHPRAPPSRARRAKERERDRESDRAREEEGGREGESVHTERKGKRTLNGP